VNAYNTVTVSENTQLGSILAQLLSKSSTSGLAAGLWRDGGEALFGAAGLAHIAEGIGMDPLQAFPAGSIIKPCIGWLALDLERCGALSLDDPLRRWLPEFNSSVPTLRQVLHHTAGIKCFTELLYWLPYPLQVHNAQRRWADSDALAIANHFPPYLEPGSGFHYSNCGYALLGLALERAASAAAGREVAMEELLRTRVWAPAGVAAPAGDTRYIRHDPPRPNTQELPDTIWPELEMHGYMQPEHGGHDVTQFETYSLYGPAGAMLSSLADLLKLSAWLFGPVGTGVSLSAVGTGVSPSATPDEPTAVSLTADPTADALTGVPTPALHAPLLHAVSADGPGKSYGMGVQIFERDWAGGRFYGHGGNVMGWSSGMWYFPGRDLHLAFVANRALVKERPIFEALLAYADAELG
jgi:CubicO group peptidase (beta-lactamase class C family)